MSASGIRERENAAYLRHAIITISCCWERIIEAERSRRVESGMGEEKKMVAPRSFVRQKLGHRVWSGAEPKRQGHQGTRLPRALPHRSRAFPFHWLISRNNAFLMTQSTLRLGHPCVLSRKRQICRFCRRLYPLDAIITSSPTPTVRQIRAKGLG